MTVAKLFVGNLAYSTTEEYLTELFEPYGELVSVRIISDRHSGLSKGYGFVEYDDARAAIAARDALNGFELRANQALVVDLARPSGKRDGGRGRFRR